MLFAYAMGLVAGEVEARKFKLDGDPGRANGPAPRQGVEIRMPGGQSMFKPTDR